MKINNNHILKLKDGRKLGWTEHGEIKSKSHPRGGTKVLFYFHGWPGCRLMAREMDKGAKKLGVRIISIDRPGYGLSDYQEGRTLLDWPKDVLELADYLKIKKFAVMGVSGGGPYAAVCGYRIPERLTKVGIVVGIAPTYIKGILDGMVFFHKLSWANYPKIPGFKILGAWLSYIQVKYFPILNYTRFLTKADRQIMKSKYKDKVRSSFKETFRQGFKGAAHDLKIYTEDYGFKLKDIKAKVYLWYGEDDKNVSLAMGKYYAKQIKGSKLIVYPGEGHFCRVPHAEEILKTLVS